MGCDGVATTGDKNIIKELFIDPDNSAHVADDNVSEKFSIVTVFCDGDKTAELKAIELFEIKETADSFIKPNYELFLTMRDFTDAGQNAAFSTGWLATTDANKEQLAENLGHRIPMAETYEDQEAHSTKMLIDVSDYKTRYMYSNTDNQTIYGQLITTGTPTYPSGTRLFLRLYFKRND